MNIKSSLQIISEMAAADSSLNLETNYTYESVRETYNLIPEADEPMVTEAADVIINRTRNGEYFVEMNNLVSFMFDSGIKEISEALDLVAISNGLRSKQVGLCIESQQRVDSVLEAAKKQAKAKNDPRIMKKAADKVNKNNTVVAKLLNKGYKVVKKSKNSVVCPKCGKVAGKCTCEFATESAKTSRSQTKSSKAYKKILAFDRTWKEVATDDNKTIGELATQHNKVQYTNDEKFTDTYQMQFSK